MPSKIRVLDEHTINQIAAGEVIENPASVVKELIDNSLDAGATEICIEIKEGGRQLIRITDNGCGMNEDDALLCLERHATSKIKLVDDLHHMMTMGFRGEAIPSIASISKFTLLTQPQQAQVGTLVIVDGGKVLKCTSAARSQGTTIEVKSLFFNVPVRKKFQKSPVYDTNEILKMMTSLSLANPYVRFELLSDGGSLLNTGGSQAEFNEALSERIRSTLGKEYHAALVPLFHAAQECKIQGFISLPYYTRPNRTGQFLFINQRPVVSPLVSFAIKDSYGTTLSPNRYPAFVLHLTLPGSLVDVNVHPQKKEVRLRQEQTIKNLILQAVSNAIHQSGSGTTASTPSYSDFSSIPLKNEEMEHISAISCFERPKAYPSYEAVAPTSSIPWEAASTPKAATVPIQPQEELLFKAPSPSKSSPLVIATLPKYLLIDSNSLHDSPAQLSVSRDSLCIVDQRAAHARIIFEKLMSRANSCEIQSLLLPHTLELNPVESAFLKEHLGSLIQLGIQIREFGQHTFMVDAIPQVFGNVDVASLIREIIQGVRESQDQNMYQREIEKRIALSASRSAIGCDKRLSMQEAQTLVNQLMQCASPYICPQGKPTMTCLSPKDLAKYFQRIST